MTKYLTLIFKNLLRTKRRTILTILSIAVSLFIFAVLVSLPTFANQMLADTTSSVRIVSRTKMGFAYPLPEAYKLKIATTATRPRNSASCMKIRYRPRMPPMAAASEALRVSAGELAN